MLPAFTVLGASFHVFMEWLFFTTKPSFLSAVDTHEKLVLPWIALGPLLGAALLLLLALLLPAWVARGRRLETICRRLARSVPAVIFAATMLLLADNFTRTLVGWGSSSLQGWTRSAPLLIFIFFSAVVYRWLASWELALERSRRARSGLYIGALSIILLSASAAFAHHDGRTFLSSSTDAVKNRAPGNIPNILLLGGDGMNAEHLSLYGYHRETTPFLDRLAREALVCDNFFSNGSSTGASLISMLTSRLPTETGVIYPPDIARREVADRHLPGLLKQLGYRTGQFTVRWYADAVDMNLQNSFDWANSRSVSQSNSYLAFNQFGQTTGYFLRLLGERLTDRLFLSAAMRERPDPFREVTGSIPEHRDDERLSALYSFVVASEKPFFAHVHLMGTHGAQFFPRRRVFSLGKEQTSDWMVDYYDDAILDFDRYVEEVAGFLMRAGLWDKTILVIYSDHGQNYTTLRRLPFVFRFPEGSHAGRISTPVQGLDLLPTLLDALGFEIPQWAEGISLLDVKIDPCPVILSAAPNPELISFQHSRWLVTPRPPFHSLGAISMIAGGNAYTLYPTSGGLEQARVETFEGTGAACPIPNPAQARTLLINHLRATGYDVSSLEVAAK